jgi:tRNA threonylcarbamoyl adenosine modification protein (Sua5/YciO/YrdC/YwlC family)
MAQIFHMHPVNPQLRLLRQAVAILQGGGVIIYPTDSAYALGCQIGNKDAMEKIRVLRQLDKKHNFTLVCRNLTEIATYAHVDNPTFRLLKANTPGPFTFILSATKEVPKRLQHEKRKTIGIRVPDNLIVQTLLSELAEPIMSVTLILPGEELPVADPTNLDKKIAQQVDLILDGGSCGLEPTTVVDFIDGTPKIARQGKGLIVL